MRIRAAAFAGLAIAFVAAWAAPMPAGAGLNHRHTAMQTLESGVLDEMNATRRTYGLAPLRMSPALSDAARQHSVEMAKVGYFAHDSAGGGSFDKRIVRYYPSAHRRFWSVGENLLWSSPDVDPATALQMWMNSPEHRANLLNPRWREVGVSAVHVASAPGAYGGREVTIVTSDFGVRR